MSSDTGEDQVYSHISGLGYENSKATLTSTKLKRKLESAQQNAEDAQDVDDLNDLGVSTSSDAPAPILQGGNTQDSKESQLTYKWKLANPEYLYMVRSPLALCEMILGRSSEPVDGILKRYSVIIS